MQSQSQALTQRLATGILLVLAVVVPGAAHADREVFRSVDADGNVIFSDTPPDSNASRVTLHTSPTRPLAESPATRSSATPQPEAEQDDAEDSATVEQEAAAMQELRTKNCERATSNLSKLQTARRVYDPQPDGSRKYLNDEELAQRKLQAQADIQRWCNG